MGIKFVEGTARMAGMLSAIIPSHVGFWADCRAALSRKRKGKLAMRGGMCTAVPGDIAAAGARLIAPFPPPAYKAPPLSCLLGKNSPAGKCMLPDAWPVRKARHKRLLMGQQGME